jgi:hypothetical protein
VKITILEMVNIAKKRDGECLSPAYIRGDSKLIWRCKEGHQWEAVPNLIKRGRWCPHCAKIRNGTIEEMQAIAKQHGGECLSKEYVNFKTKLTWQCRGGHQWQTTPTVVRRGHWCPTCSGKRIVTIEEMRQVAEGRGGKCLSKEYENNKTKLSWQCEEGHRWKAISANIKSGRWCPICAGTQKGTIAVMRKIAKGRGGQCLSAEYINSRTKLTWQCKNGHQWEALPSSIKQGHWCSRCRGKNR